MMATRADRMSTGAARRVPVYGRILVPLDGSDLAGRALSLAAALPARSIRVLRVLAEDDATPDGEASAAILAACGALHDGTVEAEVRRGSAADAIVAAAADADLLVMTTRGNGAGGQLLFGSVADLVARHAPVPTLLLRTTGEPIEPRPPACLVVPLDGSAPADRALPVARGLAERLGLPVRVVAVDDGRAFPDLAAAAGRAERAAADLRAAGLDAVGDAVSGDPRDELPALARPGDLYVMTTHGGDGAQRWTIGRVAERVLRAAPAPVLLVRSDREA